MSAWFEVTFSQHVKPERIQSMNAGLAACSNVTNRSEERTYVIEVNRPGKLAWLKEQLGAWERYGFLKWHEV